MNDTPRTEAADSIDLFSNRDTAKQYSQILERDLNRLVKAAKQYAGSVSDCCMTGERTGEVCQLHAIISELE